MDYEWTIEEKQKFGAMFLYLIQLALPALPDELREVVACEVRNSFAEIGPDRDAHLSEAERRIVALDRLAPAIRQYYEARREALDAIVAERGVGHMWQDADGIVYKTAEAEGRFVYYDRYEVRRTKRAGERAGTLSAKEATEAGFDLNRKREVKND